jgi:protein Tex
MNEQLSRKLGFNVDGAVKLLEEGNTIPFIARYRKEATGNLDEEQLRLVQAEWKALRALEERRAAIQTSLTEQGVLSPELASRLQAAATLTELEDLYLPHRPKRKTRASVARERGLEPLAQRILQQPQGKPGPQEFAQKFVQGEVASPEDALAGARDIVAELMAETPEVRAGVREKARRFGRWRCKKIAKAEDTKQTYATYYDFSALMPQLRPHQVLAMDRGESEKILSISLELEERDWQPVVGRMFRPDSRSLWAGELQAALEEGGKRLLLPAIEREVRRLAREDAQKHAIGNFATNLRGLLTVPPLSGQTVLGVDPGFRTGCKLAVVDPTGKVLAVDTLYLHQSREALATLQRLTRAHKVTLIAIGNGTASRETEQMVAEFVRGGSLAYVIVSEAGASVYSASPLARAELPDLDVTLRGAVSIARRVQDPLAELVKIEPKSIGVGMYQHDLDPGALDEALGAVVESVVNYVGVDLNTASPALLTHVAGIGSKIAAKIVAQRDANGPFRSRQQLLKVAGLGPKAFLQSAGFLRIRGGDEPLDASAIHPESYKVARRVVPRMPNPDVPALAAELGVGEPTLRDIVEQLKRPGRDPREDLPKPVLRQDVLGLDDLQPGLVLTGTVRNVVDFGAFIDLGVKQDGLLHRSQMPRGQSLAVGQVLEVEVLEISKERGRISLGWVKN